MGQTKLHRRQALERSIAAQERWIAEHGATRAGYLARYGEDSGAAIWEADAERLAVIKGQLADVLAPALPRPRQAAEPAAPAYLEPPAYLTGQAPARYRAPQIEVVEVMSSDGSERFEIEIGSAACAKCGERILRIGALDEWNHADALVSRPRRHWLGGRYDHDARP